jgi:ribosomal protein S18 acetylase RimI-like enzyme
MTPLPPYASPSRVVVVRQGAGRAGRLDEVLIESARPADSASLRDLHLETWIATYRDRLPGAFFNERVAVHRVRDWAELLRDQTALGGGVVVARAGVRVCGLCQYGPTEDDDDDPRSVGHIDRLYVHPDHQRTGVGRSLLTEATYRLRTRGMSSVTLWALQDDERARAFYERFGWQLDGASRLDGAVDVRYRS